MESLVKHGFVRAAGLPVAFILSFFAVGLPYWLIPYRAVNLPDALITPGILMVVATALVLSACGIPFWRVMGIVGSSVPAAVLARVIVDGVRDAGSHNLFPLEIIIALIMGLGCALIGAFIGTIVRIFVQYVDARKS
jgi:hypothetical protein